MADLIERSAALRVIFDSVGRPATEIYQKVRELPASKEAAELRRQRDRALKKICDFCGVCFDNRNPMECEIVGIGPEFREEAVSEAD